MFETDAAIVDHILVAPWVDNARKMAEDGVVTWHIEEDLLERVGQEDYHSNPIKEKKNPVIKLFKQLNREIDDVEFLRVEKKKKADFIIRYRDPEKFSNTPGVLGNAVWKEKKNGKLRGICNISSDWKYQNAADEVLKYVITHEVGHILGMKHPFDGAYYDTEDRIQWGDTVMEYGTYEQILFTGQRKAVKFTNLDIQVLNGIHSEGWDYGPTGMTGDTDPLTNSHVHSSECSCGFEFLDSNILSDSLEDILS